MRTLLVNPPSLATASRDRVGRSFIDGVQRNLSKSQYRTLPIEHLGLMSIAASMRWAGFDVSVINGLVQGHSSLAETWSAMVSATANHAEPGLVGFSNIDTFDEVHELAVRARRRWTGATIVLGNTAASLNWERILENYPVFDHVVVGDGEMAMTSVAHALANGSDTSHVPGVASRWANGSMGLPPPAPPPLDSLPWPARDEARAVTAAGFALAVNTTRGCPYRCTFCGTGALSKAMGPKGYRARDVIDVVDEIEFLITDYGVEFVSITDDLFFAKHPAMQERAAQFATELLRRRLHIAFMVDIRLDSVDDLHLLRHLRAAGLCRVFMGLETGSYEQLLAYGKRHLRPEDDAQRKLAAIQDLGIEIIPGTIMFHPGITPAELRATVELIDTTGYQSPGKLLDRIVPYPGTPLHRQYSEEGVLVQDWPVGRWRFATEEARLVYEKMSQWYSGPDGDQYEIGRELLLALAGEWERKRTESRSAGGSG